jgi:hypothetical protein
MMSEEIVDTSGFYRLDPNDSTTLEYAPNFVYAPEYTLQKADKDSYTYPTVGLWYWLNTKEEAYAFFNLPMPDLEA